MGKETKIAWTHSTFSPWRGCAKISEGCAHCYAEGWAKRTGKAIWGPRAKREHASEAYWKQPVLWNAEAAESGKPFRVFCASLADVCEDREDLLEPRARLMRLIETTPALTWLLCTKRPENFNRMFNGRWWRGWPKNVWVLTTVENQENANKRIPELFKVPAVVLGISVEPMLEDLMVGPYLGGHDYPADPWHTYDCGRGCGAWAGPTNSGAPEGIDPLGKCPKADVKLDWIICGGESGCGAHRFNIEWAKLLLEECTDSGTAFYMKQLGARPWWDGSTVQWINPPPTKTSALDGKNGWDVRLKDKKGGDMAEWPKELRMREFPT